MESLSWIIITVLVAALVGVALYWIGRNQSAKRLSEVEDLLARSDARANELQRGKEELVQAIERRDTQFAQVQAATAELEAEKATAIATAQAESRRAEEVIQAERKANSRLLEAKDEQIKKLNEFIEGANERLTKEFKAASSDTLNSVTKHLTQVAEGIIKANTEKSAEEVQTRKLEIEKMLQPVAETIKRLDVHVEEGEKARHSAQAVLKQEIDRLAGASESLVNAFTRPVVKGATGERMLQTVLEASGLPRELYELQHYTETDQGGARTDAVVKLPGDRKLVIDSKNLVDSYLAIDRAETPEAKQEALRLHSKALDQHIKLLSGKEYATRYGGFDFVIMFIPSESMYHEAVAHNPDLLRFARSHQVHIANPMTLLSILAALQCLCRQEKQNLYAAEIAKAGEELYHEIFRFAENMSKLGRHLGQTVDAYNNAVPGLDRFILSKSRRLSELGATSGKEPVTPLLLDKTPRGFASKELRDQNVATLALEA